MRWCSRGALVATSALALAFSMVASPGGPAVAAPERYSRVNNNPDFVQVYVNNVENLPTPGLEGCPGDWQDLTYYMKTQRFSPDLFLVQQIRDQKQLDQLTRFMTKTLVGVYDNVIANPNPRKPVATRRCGREKLHQTNAIIYRVGRFDVRRYSTWQSYSEQVDDSGAVVCGYNDDQDRTENIRVKLYDKVAGRAVTAASVHWPSHAQDGPPCAVENVDEADQMLNERGYRGSLRIIGGDMNVRDLRADGTYTTWYRRANGDLAGSGVDLRGAIFHDCSQRRTAVTDCLRSNWTSGRRKRIDFMFAQLPGGSLPFFGAETTVPYDSADQADKRLTGNDVARSPEGNYSEHRAVSARIHYRR